MVESEKALGAQRSRTQLLPEPHLLPYVAQERPTRLCPLRQFLCGVFLPRDALTSRGPPWLDAAGRPWLGGLGYASNPVRTSVLFWMRHEVCASISSCLRSLVVRMASGDRGDHDDYSDVLPALRTMHEEKDDARRARLREDVIARCLPLADHVARRFSERGEPIDDLRQVARIGLDRGGRVVAIWKLCVHGRSFPDRRESVG